MVKAGAPLQNIEACLAIEVARCANMLTVGGNLRTGQSLEIARELIAEFPNESLEDFCFCLRQGVKGAYGPIYRFDAMVVFEWFKGKGVEGETDFAPGYLQKKYDVVKDLLDREKDNLYQRNWTKPVSKESLTAENPKYDSAAHDNWLKRLAEAVGPITERKIPLLNGKDIEKEGQEKPAKKLHINGLDMIAAQNRLVLARAACQFYKGRMSFKLKEKPFIIDGYEIMAESEQDANEIYRIAKEGVTP